MSAERARIEVLPATADDRPLLEELFQFYRYDFSEFTGEEVGADGRYPPWERMPAYFSEPERFPFLVRIGDSMAGFALVRRCEAEDGRGEVTDMAEFFIMRKFRRRGVGEHVATTLFGRFPGSLHPVSRWRSGIMAPCPSSR